MKRYRLLVAHLLVVSTAVGPLGAARGQDLAAADRRVDAFLAESAWYNNHEVRLEVDGSLPGTAYKFDVAGNLVPAAGVPVAFMQNGKLAGQRKPTDPQGHFQAPVAPGIYTVFVGDLSDNIGFACASIRVLPKDGAPTSEPAARAISQPAAPAAPPTPNVPAAPKRLEMAMIQKGDVAALRALIDRKFVRPATPLPASSPWMGPADRNLATVLSSVPPAERTTAHFADARRLFLIDARRDIVPYDGPWHYRHEVFLNQKNGLQGNLRTFNKDGELQPVANAELCFVQRGSVMRSVDSSEKGAFAVSDMSPGVYSVMGANFEGYGCYGIRLVAFAGEPAPDAPLAGVKAREASFSRGVIQPGDTPDLNTTVGTAADSAGFLNAFGPTTPGTPGTVADSTGGAAGGGTGAEGLAALALAAGAFAALSNSQQAASGQ